MLMQLLPDSAAQPFVCAGERVTCSLAGDCNFVRLSGLSGRPILMATGRSII